MTDRNSTDDLAKARRFVIAAFETAGGASTGGSSLVDLGSKLTPGTRRKVLAFHEDENPWNRKVTARSTRRSGTSKPPLGQLDWTAAAMRRNLTRLSPEDFKFLSYFYDAATVKHKPWAFARVWVAYQLTLKGKNSETQKLCARMLQTILVCYRFEKLQHRDFPARPWVEFELTRTQWKRTFGPLWFGLIRQVVTVDEQILNSLIRKD